MIVFALFTILAVMLYALFTLLVNLSFLVSLLPQRWRKEPRFVGLTGIIVIAALILLYVLVTKGDIDFFSWKGNLVYGLFTGFSAWHILNRRQDEKRQPGERRTVKITASSLLLLLACMTMMVLFTFGILELFNLSFGLSFPFD